jgi:polysaccharide export outer membrane protein
VPRELEKFTLPTYVIEPPDILTINALRAVPKPPYHIAPLDGLVIQVSNAFPSDPISGLYIVDPEGTVTFGLTYKGGVRVADLTLDQARDAIRKHLAATIKDPQVLVALGQSQGLQQIRGDHLVRPDGTISLGLYGEVRVVGKSLAAAKEAIEQHLSAYLQKPEVSVDVSAYNSKVYYIISDGGGAGQQVVRLPVTGNDTVLDAVSQVYGLVPVADKNRIWVARPRPANAPCDQILPVDWVAISTRGATETNYQLLPGDRLYIHSDALVTFDTRLSRLLTPFERMFGFILLGNGTVRALQGTNNNNGNNSGF